MRYFVFVVAFSLVFLFGSCGGGNNQVSTTPVQVGPHTYLYIGTGSQIGGYAIGSSGQMTPVSGAPFVDSSTSPSGAALGSSFLYYAHVGASNISGFSVTTSSGFLSPVARSPFSPGPIGTANPPTHLAGCGGNLFATSDTAWAYKFLIQADGSSVQNYGGSSSPSGTSTGIAVDPTCKRVYFLMTGTSSSVRYYNDMTNGFSSVGTTIASAGNGATALTMDAAGKFLFVANTGGDNISAYSVDATTGSLTEVVGSPFATGSQPNSLAVVGSNLYVTNAGDNTVSAFTFDPAGALKPVTGSPFASGSHPFQVISVPINTTVSPAGYLLFVANQNSSNVSGYIIGSGGALIPMTGSPFTAGGVPTNIVAFVSAS